LHLGARRAAARKATDTDALETLSRGQETWGEEFTAALDADDVRHAALLLGEQITAVTVAPGGQSRHTSLTRRCHFDWTPLSEVA